MWISPAPKMAPSCASLEGGSPRSECAPQRQNEWAGSSPVCKVHHCSLSGPGQHWASWGVSRRSQLNVVFIRAWNWEDKFSFKSMNRFMIFLFVCFDFCLFYKTHFLWTIWTLLVLGTQRLHKWNLHSFTLSLLLIWNSIATGSCLFKSCFSNWFSVSVKRCILEAIVLWWI